MKILLVEDHPIFRFGTHQVLAKRWPSAEIVETNNLHEALDAIRNVDWSIAIVDLNLPDAEGIEVVPKLLRAAPGLRMLVLSLNMEVIYAARVLQLGAAGYLAKDRASEDLIVAIERILAGGRYISSAFAEQLADSLLGTKPAEPHEALSSQEYRVMMLLAAGRRINEIAELMNLSPKTVSTYRSRILEKLDVDGNVDLARYCISHKLNLNGSD